MKNLHIELSMLLVLSILWLKITWDCDIDFLVYYVGLVLITQFCKFVCSKLPE